MFKKFRIICTPSPLAHIAKSDYVLHLVYTFLPNFQPNNPQKKARALFFVTNTAMQQDWRRRG